MDSDSAKPRSAPQASASKAERREARLKRRAAKAEKAAASDRPLRLCSLATIEVRKSRDSYQIMFLGPDVRRTVTVALQQMGQVAKDLEAALHVIRSQQ